MLNSIGNFSIPLAEISNTFNLLNTSKSVFSKDEIWLRLMSMCFNVSICCSVWNGNFLKALSARLSFFSFTSYIVCFWSLFLFLLLLLFFFSFLSFWLGSFSLLKIILLRCSIVLPSSESSLRPGILFFGVNYSSSQCSSFKTLSLMNYSNSCPKSSAAYGLRSLFLRMTSLL